jgi:tetratricopeptide (TPR) repeat protein
LREAVGVFALLAGEREVGGHFLEAGIQALEGNPGAAADLAIAHANLGSTLRELGDLAAAEKALRQSLAEHRALPKQDAVAQGRCLHHLALCLEKSKALPDATSIARDSLATYAGAAEAKPPAAFIKDSETLYERLLMQGGSTPEAAQAAVKKVSGGAKEDAPPK